MTILAIVPKRCPSGSRALNETTIHHASKIEQWAFFLLYADHFESERLRELFQSFAFQQAIQVIEAIAAKSEDRVMHDRREKAQRDHQWVMRAAREEGRKQGQFERAVVVGEIQLLQQLLGEEESSMTDFRDVPFQELSDKVATLLQKYRLRHD